MNIRCANINDLDKIFEIESECFPEAEAATYNSLKERIIAFENSFFVGEIDGEIIGFINGCITDSKFIENELYYDIRFHNPGGAYQSVFGLDVLPKHQHKGYASTLMEYFIYTTKKKAKKGVILTCKDNLIGFYEKFGYKHIGVSNSTHGNVKWNDMILEF